MVKRVEVPGASDAAGIVVDAASAFEIRLFGQPRFTVSGQPHRFSAPPRALPLLAYLLLHRGAHLTRENVAFALWSDDSEDEARAKLRRHLHHLKEALPHAGVPWFVAEGETVSWPTPSGAWFDVEMFERHIAAGELDKAVALYAGDLLPSVYDDWIIAERERLRAQFLTALERLLLQARSRREFAAAADYARRISESDPWREDILRQLMSIRYESGDRTGSLHEFKAFADRLQRELGAEPMVETIALRDIVLRGGALPEHPDMVVVSQLQDAPNRAPLLPFVGRARELERLHDAWARAASGHGSLVLIGGEAGIGKSRLAAELALLVTAEGGRILRGSTSPGEGTPYQAIGETLRDAVSMFASLDIEPIWLSAMSVLAPDVATRYNLPPPPKLDPEREQQRLFEALAQTFVALSTQRPLLVVLEDLHWAGASSLAAIEYLARRTSTQSILMVTTYRSEEIAVGDFLPALRRRLESESVAGHIALGSLSPEEIGELVELVPDLSEDPATLSRGIAQISGGNPLFAGELIRNRIEAPSSSEIPQGISASILARAARLSASGRLLVEIASVVGSSFEVEYVREVSGYDENAVLDGLAELLDRRMIREAAVGQFEFVFAHHLVQQTIYDGIEKRKRVWWHRRVAGVLEQFSGPELDVRLGAVARHWELAGDTGRAAQRYLQAAERAVLLYAYEEAIAAATHALDLGPESDKARFEVLLLCEEINAHRGDRAAQEHDLLELRQSSIFSADAEARCRVLERVVRLRNVLDDRAAEREAIEILSEQAMPLGDDHWKAVVLELSARYKFLIGSCADARTASVSAAELYDRLGDVSRQVNALAIGCQAAASLSDFADATEGLNRLDELARQHGAANLMAMAARTRAVVAFKRDDYVGTQAAAIRALELHHSVGDRYGEAMGHELLGALAARTWHIDDARRHYALASDLFETLGNLRGVADSLMNAAGLATDLGCFDEAERLVERAAALAQTAGDSILLENYTVNMATLALARGDYILCLKICRDAKQSSNHLASLGRLTVAAAAQVRLGDNFGSAIETLEKGIQEFRSCEAFSVASANLVHLTHAYLAAAKFDDARRCVDELLQEMATLGEAFPKLWRPEILWLSGRVHAASGQTRRASEKHREARDALEELRAAIPDGETRARFSAIPLHREIAGAR
jgi:predicted ATPase/DNA-binding SARP family transcriptional activator